eukprot:c18629_g1_i3.p1 GENE.c18629_g1_i3~~c18629_g1_i3.p1  ORF type:complete len:817 (-),score=202.50 c18629_g1_i3:68-2518(-)
MLRPRARQLKIIRRPEGNPFEERESAMAHDDILLLLDPEFLVEHGHPGHDRGHTRSDRNRHYLICLLIIVPNSAQANRTPADVWAELRKFGCLKSFTAFSQDVTPVAWKWLSRTIGAEDNKATQLAPERVLVLHVECLFAYVEKQLVEHMEQVDKLFDTVWRVLHKLDDITSQERIGTVNVKEFHVAMLKLKLIKSPVVMLNVLATLGFVADSKPGTRVRFADKVWPIVRAIHHEQSSEMWATLPPSDREIELQQWHMFWNILELQYLPKYLTDRLEMTFTNYLIDRNGLEAALDDVLGTLGMELYKEEMTYLWESCNWDSSETPIKKTQRFLRVLYLISLKRVFASVRHAGGWVPEQEDLEQSKWPAMDLPITLNAVDNSLERFREHLHPTCKSLLDPVGAKWNMLSWFSPDFIRFAPPKPPRPRDFFLAQMIADIVGNVPTSPMDRPKLPSRPSMFVKRMSSAVLSRKTQSPSTRAISPASLAVIDSIAEDSSDIDRTRLGKRLAKESFFVLEADVNSEPSDDEATDTAVTTGDETGVLGDRQPTVDEPTNQHDQADEEEEHRLKEMAGSSKSPSTKHKHRKESTKAQEKKKKKKKHDPALDELRRELFRSIKDGNELAFKAMLSDPPLKTLSSKASQDPIDKRLLVVDRTHHRSLLHEAVFRNDAPITALLMATGMVRDIKPDKYGSTPLHIASHLGDPAILRVLLANKDTYTNPPSRCWINFRSKIDEQDSEGRTALIIAAHNGHLSATHALFAAGADPYVIDTAGLTAMMHATRQGHEEVAAQLRQLVLKGKRRSVASKPPAAATTKTTRG